MRKLFLFTVLTLAAVFSASAQKTGYFAVEGGGTFPFSSEYGSAKAGVSAMYLFNLGDRSHLGLGAGVAYGKSFINDYDEDMTIQGIDYDDHRKGFVSIPVFLKYKVDLTAPEASHPYLAVKAGSRIGSVKGMSKNDIRPLLVEAVPSLGYDFSFGEHFLGIELGLDMNYGQYDKLNLKELDKIDDKNEVVHYGFKNYSSEYQFIAGLSLSVVFTF